MKARNKEIVIPTWGVSLLEGAVFLLFIISSFLLFFMVTV